MLRCISLLSAQKIMQRYQSDDAPGISFQNQDNTVDGINQFSLDLRDRIGSEAGRARVNGKRARLLYGRDHVLA
jgi:hypothetical protein